MNVQALVLDFDGVIADTEPLHLLALQEVLAGMGLTLSAEDYYARYLGFDDEGVVRAVGTDRGRPLDGAEVAALVGEKTRLFGSRLRVADALYPGAADAIRRLAAAVPLAVASGALRCEIEAVLGEAGLGACFRAIVAAGETPAGKPAPDPYVRATALLGADPARTVAVEDSIWGLQSARAAGLRTVAVTTSYPASALTGADLVVPDLASVALDALDRLVSV